MFAPRVTPLWIPACAGMTVSGGRPLPHRPGHTPRACFARTRPFRRGRKGQVAVKAVVLVLVDMFGLASPLASEMLDCRRFSAGHCPRRQFAGPLDGDLHRPESGSFAHPRAVAAAPQRMGPDVCRIHDRLSGPLLGVRFRLAKATDVRWLVLPGRH